MKAEEFRIGNYLHDHHGKLCMVDEIKKDGFYAPAIKGPITILPNKPIPITEKWLLKFGFEEDGQLFHNNIAMYKNGNGGFNYNVNYFEHDNLEPIVYLHQLQNLYFALTGQELILK